jgi:hypothetical protein
MGLEELTTPHTRPLVAAAPPSVSHLHASPRMVRHSTPQCCTSCIVQHTLATTIREPRCPFENASEPVEFRLPARRLSWSASSDHVVGCAERSRCACMRAEVHAGYKAFVLVESTKRPRQASKTATVSLRHCAHRVSLHHHILY